MRIMKKSELRMIIRECVEEALSEARMKGNFEEFIRTLAPDERTMFVEKFLPQFIGPMADQHGLETKSAQIKKIESIISSLKAKNNPMNGFYIPVLNDFKAFIAKQPDRSAGLG